MDKKTLLKYVGSVEQIGGIKDYTFNDGKQKGVRAIEINTGEVCFTVLPDRCMDIAQTFYKSKAVAWFSKTGITSPYLYEKDGKNWLRGFYGGLITTCGLDNIGKAYEDKGVHGRIAHIPASKVSVFADWVGDEYVMSVSGEMRDTIVFGSNLVLKRTIKTKLFSSEIEVYDTIVNEGFNDADIALCYHCNFGYPLVNENSKIINVPDEISGMLAPTHNLPEKCVGVDYEEDVVTVGIENGEIGAYITYKRETLPEFLMWRMFGESEYVIGLEPRTSNFGGENLMKNNAYKTVKPFEEYKTELKFTFKSLK